MSTIPLARREAPAAQDLAKCVHCGLCLQHCPTYLETGQETESPRGRIHLIGALNEGRIEATEAYSLHLNRCLVCRACESACPSGVPFGRIMETARAQLDERRPASPSVRLLRRLVFEELLPRPTRLKLLARSLRLYQRAGLQRFARSSRLLKLLPERLEQAERQLPPLSRRFFPTDLEVIPACAERRHRVGFFSGCVMPYLYAEVHAATVRVLRRNHCEVVIPRAQVCCGALNVHSGERRVARQLARQNIRAFLEAGVDVVVVNAAGCGSTLKEYVELLDQDAECIDARDFSGRVRDVQEFLASIDVEPPTVPVRRRVTLQESCHLVHAQRIRMAPRQLLAAIAGLELVEMAHPDLCCGSAGIYNLTQPELSSAILDSKLDDIELTGADTIVTANPGCMLQLQRGAHQRGSRAEVKHIMQLLDEAYGGHSGATERRKVAG